MKQWILRILVCDIIGHKSIAEVKIHRNRVAGMHRGMCLRCGKILWITYPREE